MVITKPAPQRSSLAVACQYILLLVGLGICLVETVHIGRHLAGIGYQQLGKEHLEAEQPDAALKEFNQAVKLDPDNPDIYNDRALLRLNLGDGVGALADINRAVKLATKQPVVWANRCLVRLQLGDRAQALTDCN